MQNLHKLESLEAWKCSISDRGAQLIADNLHGLTKLDIGSVLHEHREKQHQQDSGNQRYRQPQSTNPPSSG